VIKIARSGRPAHDLLPRVHRGTSVLKRSWLGTHQGAIPPRHVDDCLDEFASRVNRRESRRRGKLFYRLLQQALRIEWAP